MASKEIAPPSKPEQAIEAAPSPPVDAAPSPSPSPVAAPAEAPSPRVTCVVHSLGTLEHDGKVYPSGAVIPNVPRVLAEKLAHVLRVVEGKAP